MPRVWFQLPVSAYNLLLSLRYDITTDIIVGANRSYV